MSTFLIAPHNASLFRVKITDLRCELDKGQLDTTGMFIEGDFDMFRTFVTDRTTTSSQFPQWDSFEIMFIYQTEYVEMLIAKRLKFTLNCDREQHGKKTTGDFLGEASVDLMTLATGPDTLVLRLYSGDLVVGRLFVTVEMEEIAEMKAEIKNVIFTETGDGQKSFTNWPPIFQFSKKDRSDLIVARSTEVPVGTSKRSEESSTSGVDVAGGILRGINQLSHGVGRTFGMSGSPVGGGTQRAFAAGDVVHYYSTSLPDISEDAVLNVEVCKKGWLGTKVVGTAEVRFADHLWMIDRFRDPQGLRKVMRAAEKVMDEADMAHAKAVDALEEAQLRVEAHRKLMESGRPLYNARADDLDGTRDQPTVSEADLAALSRTVEDCEDALLVAKQEYTEAATAVAETVKDPTCGWFTFMKRTKKGDEQNAPSAAALRSPDGEDEYELEPLPVIDAEDSSRVIGTLTGECHLTFMPRYCQMRAGVTVDGVVCNGIMYNFATIEPPFKSKEHRVNIDEGTNYA